MKKVTQGPADVLVSYASMTRTDVDLKGKPDANGARPQLRVGTLVVSLLDRDNRQPLLRIRVDQPMETDPAKLEEEINKAVAAAFAEYPSRKRK
jgi:hypothetical protein